jgi:hypothetical protein
VKPVLPYKLTSPPWPMRRTSDTGSGPDNKLSCNCNERRDGQVPQKSGMLPAGCCLRMDQVNFRRMRGGVALIKLQACQQFLNTFVLVYYSHL